MSIRRFTRCVGVLAVTGAALASASCGEVARTGQSPAFLIIESLEAASGAEPGRYGSPLLSDVQTLVEAQVDGKTIKTPTYFNDLGRVTLSLALKNPGLPSGSFSPTTLNSITISRYRVVYRRADGRNTPGVDVPYPFDGAFTVTVPAGGTAEASFDLVRNQAKFEAPLRNLVGLGGSLLISTIAEVTFYGVDQAGNEVMATGSISINFADFGDPS
jgi:hypothetical protein